MGFVEAIKTCFSKYADFNGRARRSEYWFWTLFVMIGVIVLQTLLVATIGTNGAESPAFGLPLILILVFSFAIILPSLAVTIRRLHDTGRSGWWYLISLIPFGGFVLLYFLILDSEPGANAYGPNPKGENTAALGA